MAVDGNHIKVPIWLIQILIATAFAIMGWTVKEAFNELRNDKTETTRLIAELNQHLTATDVRVTILEHGK